MYTYTLTHTTQQCACTCSKFDGNNKWSASNWESSSRTLCCTTNCYFVQALTAAHTLPFQIYPRTQYVQHKTIVQVHFELCCWKYLQHHCEKLNKKISFITVFRNKGHTLNPHTLSVNFHPSVYLPLSFSLFHLNPGTIGAPLPQSDKDMVPPLQLNSPSFPLALHPMTLTHSLHPWSFLQYSTLSWFIFIHNMQWITWAIIN